MSKYVLFIIVICSFACKGPAPSAYFTTKTILESIGKGKNQIVYESFYMKLNKSDSISLSKINFSVHQLISEFGDRKQNDFQVEKIRSQSPKGLNLKSDSIDFSIVHVSFGLQKEAPIPIAVVDFTFFEENNILKLAQLQVGDSRNNNTPRTENKISLPPKFDYHSLEMFASSYEGGFDNQLFINSNFDKDTLSTYRNIQIENFLELINNAKIDSSFFANDIPRTKGNPAVGGIVFNQENDSKEWMVYSILIEEPNYQEDLSEWLILRHYKFVNHAESYLISKKINQELFNVFREIVMSGQPIITIPNKK